MSIAARQERLMSVIYGPHLSEKSTIVAEENNQVVFKVRRDATKAEIRQAVEMLFEVKVDDVTVVNTKGKSKRFGLTRGRRSDWKKAYVRLAPESRIDFLGTE
ncbi:MAG: 50S ribosomal protein L23 [Gammaproteobacteria bacterium]|nr:50S ribosomal protein L23 [Gammaproteobacteria bacterium]MDH4254318.1 50S ribosomal protein L23 [Gammaproteobacteria bacterium]MDH5309172.1 50S ribosomal protein L23 [Gammaproteobacteria bacterium]